MSEQTRQIELFAAEDWQTIYTAFQTVSFASYDYDTIRQSLIDYIRINYPEDFNDYVESSEFIAIINVLAYLGQSLAFRVDLNVRENFLTDAERRESILKLAKFLSYIPNRATPSQGILKVTSIRTDDNVLDSMGKNLIGIAIDWNQTTNPDWYEQFTLILNNALQGGAKFGQPIQSVNVQGSRIQTYRINTATGGGITYPFTAFSAGQSLNYEIYNSDISPFGIVEEQIPNPNNAMNILYKNDGQGNASSGTGFFLPFKQGTLTFTDFSITTPQQNRVLIPDIPNISNNDVWVQSVSDNGIVTSTWIPVPTLFEDNLISNSVTPNIRQIYTVVTQEGDRVGIRFSDGIWGQIPTGNVRIWHRQVVGGAPGPAPIDLPQLDIVIPYFNNQGVQKNLFLTLSLEEKAIDGTLSESNQDIAERAPMVYTARNRMVSGDDYNIFPLRTNVPLKVKAINRTYAGHSRYTDIQDATGISANVLVYSNDGLLYRISNNTVNTISNTDNRTDDYIFTSVITPMLQGSGLRDFYNFTFNSIVTGPQLTPSTTGNWLTWILRSRLTGSCTGNFYAATTAIGAPPPTPTTILSTGGIQAIGTTGGSTTIPTYMNVGSMIKFARAGWTTIKSIISAGIGTDTDGSGAITLNQVVDSGDYITSVIPAFNTILSVPESNAILNAISNRLTFGLGYDYATRSWYTIFSSNLNASNTFSLTYAKDQSGLNRDNSWLFIANYQTTGWTFTSRSIEYVFESVNDCRFYLASPAEIPNEGNELAERDNIYLIPANLDSSNKQLQIPIDMNVVSGFIQNDGTYEPRRVIVRSADNDNDGIPDNPVFFIDIVPTNNIIHWNIVDNGSYSERIPVTYVIDKIGNTPLVSNSLTGLSVGPGSVVFFNDLKLYYTYIGTTNITFGVGATLSNTQLSWVQQNTYEYQYGRNNLKFEWRHYAPDTNRIDPVVTNIIDLYILSQTYYNDVIAWKSAGMIDTFPIAPTAALLESQMSSLNNVKMISDELVYHQASFKKLFGSASDPQLQATFKIVKITGDATSDTTLKNMVLSAIDTYLDPRLWDFGETFYFSQLAAYIHATLGTKIASIAIVAKNNSANFGTLYQVTSRPDELFLNVASIDDILIVQSLSPDELKIAQ